MGTVTKRHTQDPMQIRNLLLQAFLSLACLLGARSRHTDTFHMSAAPPHTSMEDRSSERGTYSKESEDEHRNLCIQYQVSHLPSLFVTPSSLNTIMLAEPTHFHKHSLPGASVS